MPSTFHRPLVRPTRFRTRLSALRAPSALALFFATISTPAHAGGVDATSDCLPPANSAYVGQFRQSFGGGTQLRNPIYHLFTACETPQGLVSNYNFGLEARFEISTDGGISWMAEVAPALAAGTLSDRGCCADYPPGYHCQGCNLSSQCLRWDEGCITAGPP